MISQQVEMIEKEEVFFKALFFMELGSLIFFVLLWEMPSCEGIGTWQVKSSSAIVYILICVFDLLLFS